MITTNNRCYCEQLTNDFVFVNQSVDYSGIEIALNRQGLLRVRTYSDNSDIFDSQDIVEMKYCPLCGRKWRINNGRHKNAG